jgi:HK97 family phage prohead protease
VSHAEATERLHQYWVHGAGAGKIGWGAAGDFERCVHHLGKYIGDPQGYCNLAHHAATGMWPAQHAEMEHAGRADMTGATRAQMSTQSINDLPDSDFAYIEPGGKKDSSGRTVPRSLRHFPVHDAAHTRDALSRAPQSPFGDRAMPKIRAAAKKFGIDSGDGDSGSSRMSRSELMRDYPLEDLHIVRSENGGDGRTMEAFAAVFNTETGIRDHEGRYLEIIDPAAFNKRVADLKRSRQGFGQVKVLFNHGRDMEGAPAERFQMPVAVPVSIEATPRGLLTRSRFVSTALGDEVLELVRSGAVTAMSFTGQIIRSDPHLSRGGRHRPDSAGRLTTVRRLELGLREFGPVLFPAYEGAEIAGVRMSTPGAWEPDEFDDAAPAPDEEAAPGSPLARSDGDVHEARYHQHALYALRSRELREKAGLVW